MNLPNKLTCLRMALMPVMVILFFCECYISATAVFLIASFTDMLDGKIARKRGLVTTFGKFVDPLADKLICLAAFALIAVNVFSSGTKFYGTFATVTAVTVISREIIITGFRALAAEKGAVIAADKVGKIKTVFQDTAIVLLFLDASPKFNGTFAGELIHWTGAVMLVTALVLTVVSGVNYFVKNREITKEIFGDI